MAKTEDSRKWDVGQAINIVLNDGRIVKGKVYAVRYQYPQPELRASVLNEGSPHELTLPPENVDNPEKVLNTVHEHQPHERIITEYIIEVGQKQTDQFNQAFDPKTKKITKVPIFEPIYETISPEHIRD